jgi:ditrans,polycis-polyprenyl diphosphate synthase
MNVQNVSFYALSIENFKRPKEELDLLLDLALETIMTIRKKVEFFRKHKVCVRFLGNLDLLPVRIQILIGELHQITLTFGER